MKWLSSLTLQLFPIIAFSTLTGCNSGSSQETETDWQQGDFPRSQEFANYCAAPRTGTDPYTNSPYPDLTGSAYQEKMWVRSWNNETYLWYQEVLDISPEGYEVEAYFNQLKTTATTTSGAAKDNFHFTMPSAEWNQRSQSGVVSGYGIHWVYGTPGNARARVVSYVEPGSPAANAGLTRGAFLIEADNVRLQYATSQAEVDTFFNAVYPQSSGEAHQFAFQYKNEQTKTYSLVSANVTTTPVLNTKVLENDGKSVGYMQFNSHIVTAQSLLIDAINQFKQASVSEVILDMRYNGGGLLAMASQFTYMLAGTHTQGKFFEKTIDNGKFGYRYEVPFYQYEINYEKNTLKPESPLPTLNLDRVIVLTGENTCSASEAVVNGLRGVGVDVVQIGGTTCGKPYGFFPEDNCGTTYFTIQFQGVNYKNFGDYADGFKPTSSVPQYDDQIAGCPVEDDFDHLLGSNEEALLSAALGYINNSGCPVATTSKGTAGRSVRTTLQRSTPFRYPDETPWLNNRIYTPIQSLEHSQ